MQFSCPMCGSSVDVGDELAGKGIDCPKCGKAIIIPDKGGCPRCGAPHAGALGVCVVCGYVLDPSARGPIYSPSSSMMMAERQRRNASIKQVLLLLFLIGIGVGGYYGYQHMLLKPYGIGPDAPLGLFTELDTEFAEKLGFARIGGEQKVPTGFPDYARAVRYSDTSSKGGAESIVVILDEAGYILGIGGKYIRPLPATPPAGWSKTTRFLRNYWKQVGCGDPLFKRTSQAKAFLTNDPEVASFEDLSIAAEWVKTPRRASEFENLRFLRSEIPLAPIFPPKLKGTGTPGFVVPKTFVSWDGLVTETMQATADPVDPNGGATTGDVTTPVPVPVPVPVARQADDYLTAGDRTLLAKRAADEVELRVLILYAKSLEGRRAYYFAKTLVNAEMAAVKHYNNQRLGMLRKVITTVNVYGRYLRDDFDVLFPKKRHLQSDDDMKRKLNSARAELGRGNKFIAQRYQQIDLMKRQLRGPLRPIDEDIEDMPPSEGLTANDSKLLEEVVEGEVDLASAGLYCRMLVGRRRDAFFEAFKKAGLESITTEKEAQRNSSKKNIKVIEERIKMLKARKELNPGLYIKRDLASLQKQIDAEIAGFGLIIEKMDKRKAELDAILISLEK